MCSGERSPQSKVACTLEKVSFNYLSEFGNMHIWRGRNGVDTVWTLFLSLNDHNLSGCGSGGRDGCPLDKRSAVWCPLSPSPHADVSLGKTLLRQCMDVTEKRWVNGYFAVERHEHSVMTWPQTQWLTTAVIAVVNLRMQYIYNIGKKKHSVNVVLMDSYVPQCNAAMKIKELLAAGRKWKIRTDGWRLQRVCVWASWIMLMSEREKTVNELLCRLIQLKKKNPPQVTACRAQPDHSDGGTNRQLVLTSV